VFNQSHVCSVPSHLQSMNMALLGRLCNNGHPSINTSQYKIKIKAVRREGVSRITGLPLLTDWEVYLPLLLTILLRLPFVFPGIVNLPVFNYSFSSATGEVLRGRLDGQ
jgi:hypothetical protein